MKKLALLPVLLLCLTFMNCSKSPKENAIAQIDKLLVERDYKDVKMVKAGELDTIFGGFENKMNLWSYADSLQVVNKAFSEFAETLNAKQLEGVVMSAEDSLQYNAHQAKLLALVEKANLINQSSEDKTAKKDFSLTYSFSHTVDGQPVEKEGTFFFNDQTALIGYIIDNSIVDAKTGKTIAKVE